MNVILEKFQNVKILASAALGVITLGMAIGYSLAPRPEPKEVICSKEIEQVKLLSSQMKALRQQHLQEFEAFQKECILEQNKVCSEKIIRYRAACLELKCEVCKASR